MMRLMNGFSKKWENHWAALCLWFGYYNLLAGFTARSALPCNAGRYHGSRLGHRGATPMNASDESKIAAPFLWDSRASLDTQA
jgi:hypothetical protein